MDELDLRYVHECQKPRYQHYWEKKLSVRHDLATENVQDAIVLPAKVTQNGEDGGVLSPDGKPVEKSYLRWGNSTAVGGAYDFDRKNLTRLEDDEYVYLGMLYHHYGHMIIDCSTRLWAMKNNPGLKGIYIVQQTQEAKLSSVAKRMIELSGINPDNIIVLNQPARVKNLIVPEQGYCYENYISPEYLGTFEDIVANIKPTRDYNYDKVFFSRTKFNQKARREIGTEVLDALFESAGFEVIHPERYSLDDQIAIMRHATEYACIQGTLVHNLIFMRGTLKKIYIVNKTYFMGSQYFDSCKLAGYTPLFLDFYTVKYPTRIFNGPFIFLCNDFMRNFIKDNNIELMNKDLFTEEYNIKNMSKYEFMFLREKAQKNNIAFAPTSIYDAYYYDISWLMNWINNYEPLIARKNPLLKYEEYADAIKALEIKLESSGHGWKTLARKALPSSLIKRLRRLLRK